MADKKISELETRNEMSAEDLLMLVAAEDGFFKNQKIRVKEFFNNIKSWIGLDDGIDFVNESNLVCSIENSITHLSGAVQELTTTLNDGNQGQIKIIVMTAAQNPVHVTGNFAGFSKISFSTLGSSATLIFTNNHWVVLGSNNIALI